ncbi:MAG: carboxy terminal-processing peptidase [Gammaproteobacteria bacterium]
MHIVRMSVLFRVAALGLALLASVALAVPEPAEPGSLAPTDRHGKVSRLVTTLFERSHYNRSPIDDGVSARVFDTYLDTIDGGRQYFLASDIEEFQGWRYELDDALKRGHLNPVFEIYARYVDRARERMQFAIAQLDEEPDFTIDEEYVFDREDLPWPATEAEMDDLWRKRVKNDAVALMLTDKDWAETREILGKRYNQVLNRLDQVKSDDVFEAFMNAFSHTLDPHSSYFSPRNSEEYRIRMSLNYDGIGASLQMQDEYVTVMGVIEGGPAAIDGTLKPKDRIVAVAQGEDGEMVDVVGWRLDDVVDMIRGPGGSTVRLQILPAGAAPGSGDKVLSLVRDKVKLEAQAAKKDVIEIERGDETRRIGIIEVPSFYQDYNARAAGDDDYVSTTADVRRLTRELMDEGIDGLVIDLRNNGGGHLSEATAMTGLFIDKGPVVQLRDTRGSVEVLDDPVPEVVYDGPLAVLVNRFSASASEIFAAAIQDYDRGLVIGQQTYGKGTVQNLYPLDRYAPGDDPRFGQLTLTVGKYYRVTGGSTQHRGVVPDILMPSPVHAELVGESTQESALPWDQISPTSFDGEGSVGGAIDYLTDSHERRVNVDPDLRYLIQDIEARDAVMERKAVSLNLEKRREENERMDVERLARENARREAKGLEPLESLEALDEAESPDVVLEEAAEIVADLSAQAPGALTASSGSAESP